MSRGLTAVSAFAAACVRAIPAALAGAVLLATTVATAAASAPTATAPAASTARAATLSSYFARPPAQHFYLPQGLTEVSGLAVASANSVFAHDDNYGIVYEIDLGTGRVLRAFALGKPTVKGDFEDIAVRAGTVYLLESDGRLFEATIGEHRQRVRYNVYDTGVGTHCETEGLANGPKDGEFLILCKKPHRDKLKDRLVIYLWSITDRAPVSSPWLNVPLDGLVEPLDQANFHPSAFYWQRELGRFLIVSAKGHSAIEIDEHGKLIDRVKLDKVEHPQPEGLVLMPDGRLVISDEGSRGHGKIAIYALPR
jgi:uncharacterized protein YjiK